MKRSGILTWVTITLLVLFGIADVAAEVSGDGTGKYGETFSTWIFHLEKRSWIYRAVAAAFTIWLFLHLTFQFP